MWRKYMHEISRFEVHFAKILKRNFEKFVLLYTTSIQQYIRLLIQVDFGLNKYSTSYLNFKEEIKICCTFLYPGFFVYTSKN